MVGVGKLLKQAQKMQQKMEEAQAELSNEILEVSGGGGAVSIKITGQGEFKELTLDPEFLKEDAEFVSEAILQAVVDASEQAKKKNDEAMSGLTGGMPNADGINRDVRALGRRHHQIHKHEAATVAKARAREPSSHLLRPRRQPLPSTFGSNCRKVPVSSLKASMQGTQSWSRVSPQQTWPRTAWSVVQPACALCQAS